MIETNNINYLSKKEWLERKAVRINEPMTYPANEDIYKKEKVETTINTETIIENKIAQRKSEL